MPSPLRGLGAGQAGNLAHLDTRHDHRGPMYRLPAILTNHERSRHQQDCPVSSKEEDNVINKEICLFIIERDDVPDSLRGAAIALAHASTLS